jgi:thioredoxin reductase (NADPH)
MKHVDVVIIGGGPAGISAAIWCHRLGIDYLLIEKEEALGGQLIRIHNEIIDYPGLYAKNGKEMKEMFEKHFADLGCLSKLKSEVTSVNTSAKTVMVPQLGEIKYTYLILATGAGQRYLDVPGEKDMLFRGETYSATVDSHLFKEKRVAIVGGGDRAFEGAVLLADAGAEVHLIIRSKILKARQQYIDLAAAKKNIIIHFDTQVTRINGEQRVMSVELVNKEGQVTHLQAAAVLVRIGIKPNNEIVSGLVDITEEGFIVTDSIGKTSDRSIYAIGDICTKPLFSSIALSIGQGALVAKHLSSLLNHHK